VRAAAYHSLYQLVLATSKAFPAASTAASTGNPSFKEPQDPSPQQRHVLAVVLPLLTGPCDCDTSKIAVAAAAGSLVQVLKLLGQGGVEAQALEAVCTMTQALLANRAICQEVEDDDEDGGEDEADLAAADEDLLTAAADLLPALAASMGRDGYAPVFLAQHAEPLLSRLKPQVPAGLRAIAAGAAAEVAEVLGPHMAPAVAQLLQLLLRELQTDVSVRGWMGMCVLSAGGS
jgi:hypothetical protein